jgi:hypothetical protein
VQEESVAKAARELRKDKGRGTVKSAEWLESDGLLMFCGKIYVLKDRDFRRRIVEQHYNMRIAGHAGCFKTLELISCNYWWPQMSCSTSRPVICATGQKCNVDDLSVNSTLQRHWRHHGR